MAKASKTLFVTAQSNLRTETFRLYVGFNRGEQKTVLGTLLDLINVHEHSTEEYALIFSTKPSVGQIFERELRVSTPASDPVTLELEEGSRFCETHVDSMFFVDLGHFVFAK